MIRAYLELTHEEVETLRRALDVRLRELREELAHTDDRAYHKDLRKELDCLEDIDRQLEGPFESKRSA